MKMKFVSIALTVCVLSGLGFSGCSAGNQSSPAPVSSNATSSGTVNLVVQDTPPSGITVLSFQLQIASATLQPGSISLLKHPVTVDLAQLVTDTSFLASQVVDSGTYTSLTSDLCQPADHTDEQFERALGNTGGYVCGRPGLHVFPKGQ